MIKQSKVICGLWNTLCGTYVPHRRFHQNERRFKMAKPDGMKNHRKGPGLEVILLYAFLIVLAILFVLPIFYLFMGSFKAESELFRTPFKWLPDKFRLDNFVNMFSSIPFFMYLKNTMIIVICNIVGSLLSCSLVAYGFSRLRWPGRDKVFILVLVTMILPYQVTLVPLFLMFTKMKWIGTFLPLTVTCFFGNPFFIFLLRQFFTGIPQDISEAARIDGAGEFTAAVRFPVDNRISGIYLISDLFLPVLFPV